MLVGINYILKQEAHISYCIHQASDMVGHASRVAPAACPGHEDPEGIYPARHDCYTSVTLLAAEVITLMLP